MNSMDAALALGWCKYLLFFLFMNFLFLGLIGGQAQWTSLISTKGALS